MNKWKVLLNKFYQNELPLIEKIEMGVSPKKIYRVCVNPNEYYIIMDYSACKICDEVTNHIESNKTQLDYYLDVTEIVKNKIRIPKLYYYDKNKMITIVQDVGKNLLKNVKMIDNNWDLFSRSLIEMVKNIKNIKSIKLPKDSYLSKRIIDNNVIYQELLKFYDLTKHHYKDNKDYEDNKDNKDNDKIVNLLKDMANKVDKMPKTVVHRDYQTTNALIKDDKLYIIDYQDLCIGPIHHDFVSLIYDVNVDITEKHREYLIDLYLTDNNIYDINNAKQEIYLNGLTRVMQSLNWRIKQYKLNNSNELKREINNGFNNLLKIKKSLNDKLNKKYDAIFDYIMKLV